MDQKLDFSPGDKPDVGKTATLELTPKQTELVTLAVKMGDLSLVLRSLQDVNDDGRDAAAENAPAEPGDSFTEDSQVSRLIRPASAAAPAVLAPLLSCCAAARATNWTSTVQAKRRLPTAAPSLPRTRQTRPFSPR